MKVATLNFVGNAAYWLQSVRNQLIGVTWFDLCDRVCALFTKDRQETLVRQWFHIRQTGSVSEYVKFDCLMHQLLAYEQIVPPVFFVQKFIDGLKDEVRRVVIVQRPQDMDAASSLALLQEEAIEGVKFGMVRKSEGGTYVKSLHKTNSQSQLTTTQHSHSNRDTWTTPVDDKKNGDPSRIREDRVSALRTYRRSKGLCFTCGEKWSKDHKCSTSVQLHMVQELVSLLQDESNSSEQVEVQDEKEDLIAMAISQHAASGTEAAHSIRLRGWIQETELLMLIDSGSTNSFIDEQVAMKLKGLEVLKQPLKV